MQMPRLLVWKARWFTSQEVNFQSDISSSLRIFLHCGKKKPIWNQNTKHAGRVPKRESVVGTL
jgi:hypothetical protein